MLVLSAYGCKRFCITAAESCKCYLSVAPIKIQTPYHWWHLNAVAGLAGVSHEQAIARAIRAVHLVQQGDEMDFLRCLYQLLK